MIWIHFVEKFVNWHTQLTLPTFVTNIFLSVFKKKPSLTGIWSWDLLTIFYLKPRFTIWAISPSWVHRFQKVKSFSHQLLKVVKTKSSNTTSLFQYRDFSHVIETKKSFFIFSQKQARCESKHSVEDFKLCDWI